MKSLNNILNTGSKGELSELLETMVQVKEDLHEDIEGLDDKGVDASTKKSQLKQVEKNIELVKTKIGAII